MPSKIFDRSIKRGNEMVKLVTTNDNCRNENVNCSQQQQQQQRNVNHDDHSQPITFPCMSRNNKLIAINFGH